MRRLRLTTLTASFLATLSLSLSVPSFAETVQSYVFGTRTKPAAGDTMVTAAFSPAAGFGFDGEVPTLQKQSATGKPFFFSTDLPEGNYRVTLTLGGDQASETTVKAELRRLMLERVSVPAGGSVTRRFIVNIRTPDFPDGRVALKAPREVVTEARAWDERLTLEFDGTPAVRALRIERVDVPTVFLLGDSTVADQSGEPYASWGQMLPRFFAPTIAVANHSESGESTFSSKAARRFDKILSLAKPGDYVLIQFGHNDQKSTDPDKGLKYKANLIEWAQQVKQRGAIPVIITPMHRNRFAGDRVTDTLAQFPELARQAAQESGARLIDLNTESRILYEAVGPHHASTLFMHSADYAQKDGTHHSPYGAYELAKIVIQKLRDSDQAIAAHIDPHLSAYDAAHPAPESAFKVPPSVTFAVERPLGVNQE